MGNFELMTHILLSTLEKDDFSVPEGYYQLVWEVGKF
jgi:hypothetical protein